MPEQNAQEPGTTEEPETTEEPGTETPAAEPEPVPEPVNNLGSVRAWLRTCPSVARNVPFGADYLADDPNKYALVSTPSQRRVRENILGEVELLPVQVQNFVFAYRAPYGAAVAQNLDNLAFFQAVEAWIWEQNAEHNMPDWEGGTIESIVPTLSPTIMEYGTATARYQIQIRVTYQVRE